MIKLTSALKVAAPVYVCDPEVVILPPMLEVPVMVNAEVLAVLVMVPARFKVAKVCVACRSRVAPPAILRSVLALTLPVSLMVPAEIVVFPE